MSVSDKPWGQFSPADYTPESYCSAALIDQNGSGPKAKDKCHLPVREPGGALNRNGVHAAAARLAGAGGGVTSLSASEKKTAARKLVGLYREIGDTPPASITALAG